VSSGKNLTLVASGYGFPAPSAQWHKSSLDESSWKPLESFLGDDSIQTFPDPSPMSTQRLYRIKAE
jgi:hypothetical protein